MRFPGADSRRRPWLPQARGAPAPASPDVPSDASPSGIPFSMCLPGASIVAEVAGTAIFTA